MRTVSGWARAAAGKELAAVTAERRPRPGLVHRLCGHSVPDARSAAYDLSMAAR